MGTKLYWVDGPWLGKLALAARPRGGDWLCDELKVADRVVSEPVQAAPVPNEAA